MPTDQPEVLLHPKSILDGKELRLYHDGAVHIHKLCGRAVGRTTISNWARRGYPIKKRLGVYLRFPEAHKAGHVYTTRETLDAWWREVMRRSAKAGVIVNDPFRGKGYRCARS